MSSTEKLTRLDVACARVGASPETDRLCDGIEAAWKALEEITKREGPYSQDRQTHAENCVESMAEIASAALPADEGGG